MKQFLLLSTLFLSLALHAEESEKHMISITSKGLGWSGAVEKMSTTNRSTFDDLVDIRDNFSFNYAYRITDRIQLGGFVQTGHTETEFNKKDGDTSRSERELTSVGVFALQNFSSVLSEAYYAGLAFTYTNSEEEISHDFANSEGKAPIETDDLFMTYEVVFGKRFPLKHWNIQNLVYSPQLSAFYRTHGKDFDDQGVDYGWGASLQPIKFDLLF